MTVPVLIMILMKFALSSGFTFDFKNKMKCTRIRSKMYVRVKCASDLINVLV